MVVFKHSKILIMRSMQEIYTSSSQVADIDVWCDLLIKK